MLFTNREERRWRAQACAAELLRNLTWQHGIVPEVDIHGILTDSLDCLHVYSLVFPVFPRVSHISMYCIGVGGQRPSTG